MQGSGVVDHDDAAAAGADLGDVDRRGAQEIPSALVEPAATGDRAAHLELARSPDLVLLDDGGLGRRAAHIEADDIGKTEPARQCRRADHPRRRPGFDQLDRAGSRPRRGHDAAVRLHRQQRRPYLEGAEPGFERGQIPV